MGPIAVPLFELLEEQAAASDDPWPLVEGLLRSRDVALARRALEAAERLAESGSLVVDRRVVRFLADEVERAGSPLGEADALAAIARLLRRPGTGPRDPVLALYLEPAGGRVRGLAARLLDLRGQPAPPPSPRACSGRRPTRSSPPTSRYTRATHRDLLHLQPDPGRPPPALALAATGGGGLRRGPAAAR